LVLSKQRVPFARLTALGALVFLVTTIASPAVANHTTTKTVDPSVPGPECTIPDFDPSNFPSSPRIDNLRFPLTPGTQAVFEGRANRGGGPLPHQVKFTATDLTKVIAGVRTLVMYDLDINEGVLSEAELAFFAQDNAGNVWNLGEYPEEYEDRKFVGAPNVWVADPGAGVLPGIHMYATPVEAAPGTAPYYLQGWVPDIEFLDCAYVKNIATGNCIPTPSGSGCYRLVTHERSPYDPCVEIPGAPDECPIQLKYHADGVGIIEIGALNDPEGETLVRTQTLQLDRVAMAQIRRAALRLDKRGYRTSQVYRQSAPIGSARR
jgi:hypothetical protein